jgi:hypothetical protein
MLKQYKQNQNLTQRNIYEIRAKEKNPKALPYIARRVNYPVAGKPLISAWYLLEYIIDTYPGACARFGQIVELLGSSGCQLLINDWLDCLIGEKTATVLLEDVKNKYGENTDVIHYTKVIDKFVLDTFNRKEDKDNLRHGVTLMPTPFSKGSRYLHAAIEFRSLANYYAFNPEKYMDLEAENAMTSNKDSRIKRRLTQFFKKLRLWDMSHKKSLINDAESWYKSRICPGNIEKYRDELALSNKYPERGNIENLIAPYDVATGYPRKWRK